MTLLRELIEIPEAVHKGDFVMSLAAGVADRSTTLAQYVVTPQLALAFQDALGFVASALVEGRSKAAHLDGSFGSGKSHFMAVLHMILDHDPAARAVPELAAAIGASDAALSGRSFALVPFHMIGAESMEQAIFGGYVEHLRRSDPDAAPPGVYRDQPLFQQAEISRGQMGDERFFAELNAGGADEGWGKLGAAWTPETYDRARSAPSGDAERGRLSGAIVARLLPAFRDAVRGSASAYVDLDVGLAELARHSRDRGHDALVLFLDELVLWLGSRMGDPAFVAREGQKLIKLIEFTTPRPIPIVSFVARQRDLRDFVGDQIPGAERLSFADALKHWDDRFHRVRLEDRNLPMIAERRLLRPIDEAARIALDAAFHETERARPEVLDVLMTEDGDRALFRATYPFSPAVMKALVAASSALQRERTALRVMLQLLVDRRDDLALGDLVSVGDLFDVLARGDEPFTQEMGRQLDLARALYRDELRPALLDDHGLGDRKAESLGAAHPFGSDDRLVKTLLLAALVPEAAPLRNMDLARLTALNHGSIASPIPGGEKAVVLAKLRRWAGKVGALKLGNDPHNPSVQLRLTGVDVARIVERAQHVDNAGERRRLVRAIVLEELGVQTDTRLFDEYRVLWRGTWRTVDVVFGNIRDTGDLPDDTLRATGGRWKVVVDYPFDPGHTPLEDLERLERWRAAHGDTKTVAWVPAFFSQALQGDLATLVILTHVLGGERLEQFADHLGAQDRAQARGLLSDQRSALEQRLRSAIRQAYGVERAAPETIDASHGIEERIQSLREGFVAQIPIGASLGDAFAGLVRQLLDVELPDHPRFEAEVRARDLRETLGHMQAILDAGTPSVEVDAQARKAMRHVAMPLGLGTQYESRFEPSTRWKDTLDRAVGRILAQGGDGVSVGDLRRAIDDPQPLGLPREVQSLVILVYAHQTGRVFRQHGGPADPTIERLDDDLELVLPALPGEAAWRIALLRASSLLGLADVSPALSPRGVERLAGALRSRGEALLPDARAVAPMIADRLRELGGDPEQSPRVATARVALALASILAAPGDPADLIERFAGLDVAMQPQHLGTSLAKAGSVARALGGERWGVLSLAVARARDDDPGFATVAGALRHALVADEFAAPAEGAVARAHADALALLAGERTVVAPVGPTVDPHPPDPPPLGVQVVRGRRSGLTVAQAKSELQRLDEADGEVLVDLDWTVSTRPAPG